jgi:hypothetical protein
MHEDCYVRYANIGTCRRDEEHFDFLIKVFISTLAILYYETIKFPCDGKLTVSSFNSRFANRFLLI